MNQNTGSHPMTHITKPAALAAAVILAFAGQASGASAQTVETVKVAVRTGDLDLASPAGARRMLSRIRLAAAWACEDQTHSPLMRVVGYQQCVRQASERAVTELGSPAVAALDHAGPAVRLAGKN
jgi:UrcA family protein